MDDNRRGGLKRRRFLEYVCGSPLWLSVGAMAAQRPAETLIESPKDALNIFDFISASQKQISPAHWAFLMTGADDNLTVQANCDGFKLFQIRARRFVDVAKVDLSVELYGQRHPTPIMLAPCGSLRAFHDEGELAAARAARTRGAQVILSTVSSYHVRDVAKEYGRPLYY